MPIRVFRNFTSSDCYDRAMYQIIYQLRWQPIISVSSVDSRKMEAIRGVQSAGKGDADTKIFPFKEYEEFQVGAGKALESAEKVFVKPFEGMNLKEVPKKDLENMEKMALLAVENENLFNTALEVRVNNDFEERRADYEKK
ncbi:hypothetical protein BY996DRAFT_6467959 [Phakopsora pachyrhizi]|uniref:Uncharacterized protein n=1 Tax=Phakopsora pachyrhizi TaxID=170000 RepID=A0AAV0BQK5_PHAPC|nr:hypothetical protein BY996DRAFT_6467959 [Phakopsora pachyrhizi]CAH7688496.1 hypothetical protein PPACK8108_LOCUS23469 [Phakopsora pachyrhizi]